MVDDVREDLHRSQFVHDNYLTIGSWPAMRSRKQHQHALIGSLGGDSDGRTLAHFGVPCSERFTSWWLVNA